MERIGMRREAHFVHSEIVNGEWADELVFRARCMRPTSRPGRRTGSRRWLAPPGPAA
jgi:hypothetical protein